jgi:tetratricopeptide (TPR) repeat protein
LPVSPTARLDAIRDAAVLRRLRDAAVALPVPFLRAEALARVGVVFLRQGDRVGAEEVLRLAENALSDGRGADTVRAWGEVARAWRIAGENQKARAALAKAAAVAQGGGMDGVHSLLTARVAGGERETAIKMLPQRAASEADPLFAAWAVALARYGPAEDIDRALDRIGSADRRAETTARVTALLTITANAALLYGDADEARIYASAIPAAEARDAMLLVVARDQAATGDAVGLEATLKSVRDYAIRDEMQKLQVGLLVDTYIATQNPTSLSQARDIMDRMKTETARQCAEARILPARARTDFTEIPGKRAKAMGLSAAKVVALAGVARVRTEQGKLDEARALVREALAVLPMIADAAARDAARTPLVEALAVLGEDEVARTVAAESENRVHAVTRLGRAALLAHSRALRGGTGETEAREAEKAAGLASEKIARSRVDRDERAPAFLSLAKARTEAGDAEEARAAWREAALAAQAASNFDLLLRIAAELRRGGETETAARLFEQAVEEAVRTSDRDLRLVRIETVGEMIGSKGVASAPKRER